jgi:hypothetical protein
MDGVVTARPPADWLPKLSSISSSSAIGEAPYDPSPWSLSPCGGRSVWPRVSVPTRAVLVRSQDGAAVIHDG